MPPRRPHGPRPPRGGPPPGAPSGAGPFRPGGPPGGQPRGAESRAGGRDRRPARGPSRDASAQDERPARVPARDARGGDAQPRAPFRGHGERPEPPRLTIAPAPRDRAAPHQGDREPIQKEGNGVVWLHGLHAVAAALANPRRRLRRLLVTAEAEAALAERVPGGIPKRMQAERVEDRARFHSFLPEDAVHQGAALLAEPLPNVALDDALAASPGPVLLLDQVTDPRNVGAILRSAAAFGAAAVVMQDRHAPPETGALARAASGALEVVPVVREVNLARAIRHLQDRGAWVMGLAGDATRTLAQAKPPSGPGGRRAALVLGAEGSGLRRLQRETCDELVRLPIAAATESLNVAAAAAVALYEIARDSGGDA